MGMNKYTVFPRMHWLDDHMVWNADCSACWEVKVLYLVKDVRLKQPENAGVGWFGVPLWLFIHLSL